MKKNLLLLCLPLAIILTPSCMKEDLPDKHHQQQAEPIIITVELIKNQTYHYTLPQNLSDKPFRITEQALHFSASEISTDKIYTYTPALDYLGTDRVVIANEKEEHDNNGCGNNNNNNNGGCNHNNNNNNNCDNNDDNEIGQTIIINFVIKEKQPGKHFRTTICPSF